MSRLRPQRRRRGVMFIMAFVTLVIVTMLVGAAFTLLPTQLQVGLKDEQSSQLLSAVSAGADYVQSRLQDRTSWRGDLTGSGSLAGYTVNTPELQIYEDKGNVLGVVVAKDGSKQAFRVRFNYQNGSNLPEDGFSQDPAANHKMKFGMPSVNNLANFSSKPLYLADSSGSVTSTTSTDSVGRYQTSIFIQGMAGPGLRSATVDTLESFAGRRDVLTRVVNTRIGFLNQALVDSAAYAGGGILTDAGGDATLTNAPDVSVANIRALDTLSTAGTTTLKATSPQSRGYYSSSVAPNSGVQITNQQQSKAAQESHWLKMKWSQVPKAPTNSPTRLKAGTYVWQKNASTSLPELAYYPQDYSGSGAFTPSTSPTIISSAADMMTSIGTGVSLDTTTMTTTFSDSVYIDSVAGAQGFSVLIDPTYQAALPTRPSVVLDPDPAKTCIISTPGSLFVQGKIEGVGSITTEGDMKIQGTSLFEADPGDSVVLYSKKDISVESIPPSVAAAVAPVNIYKPGMGMGMAMGWRKKGTQRSDPSAVLDGDVSFAGAVFAMGNFNTNITNGNLYIRGVLSAYGGDPETQPPGSVSGSGKISIKTPGTAEFMYDPSYLMNGANAGTIPARLDRFSWNLLDI